MNTPENTEELTPNQKATEIGPDTASMPYTQTCGQTCTHINATIYKYPVCYTMGNEPHNVPLTGITTFDGQNTSKLEDWLIDIETKQIF